MKFADVPALGMPVHRGMTHDGLGHYLSQMITKAPGATADIAGILRETGTHVVVNFLPVGSEMATKWYVEQVLDAGCAFVNCIPVFIAREPYWQRRFEEKGLPIVGDDVKSPGGRHHRSPRPHAPLHGARRAARAHEPAQLRRQHRLLQHARARAAHVEEDLEDGLRALAARATSWRPTTCTSAPATTCRGSKDRKWAHIRLEGRGFGDQPINVELKLEVWDSPNSAGVVIDAIRTCKIALDRGLKGALRAPSAWLMKSPPEQWADDVARTRLERFIAGEE